MIQDFLASVTDLAHYLTALTWIALACNSKLEKDYDVRDGTTNFLDKWHLLAVEGSKHSTFSFEGCISNDHGSVYNTRVFQQVQEL